MAEPAADYHRGDMDIAEQKATFRAVMSLSKWCSLALAAGLVYLTLQFCTDANFFQSFGAALVVTVIGVAALREKKPSGH